MPPEATAPPLSPSPASPHSAEADPLTRVRQLIERHRLVESLLSRQQMPRHALVEGLVHRQHLGELRVLVSQLESGPLAGIVEQLPLDDALLLWSLLDERTEDAVLLCLEEQRRDEIIALTPDRSARSERLRLFELRAGHLVPLAFDLRSSTLHGTPVWVDLLSPSARQLDWIAQVFGLRLPDPASFSKVEPEARYREEDDADLECQTNFLRPETAAPGDAGTPAQSVPVGFVLHGDVLFSVRNETVPAFRAQRVRAAVHAHLVRDGKDVLLDLYAADIETCADALEAVYQQLEQISAEVLGRQLDDRSASSALSAIALAENRNGRLRRNMQGTRRALSFLLRSKLLDAAQMQEAQQILRDIDSLDGHTAFLFDKINFLMDATVGFINLNQNRIIKLFSVASVALLPPTLVASMYGMNFQHMPELQWEYGYPWALGLMVASVVTPLWWFRRRGWL